MKLSTKIFHFSVTINLVILLFFLFISPYGESPFFVQVIAWLSISGMAISCIFELIQENKRGRR